MRRYTTGAAMVIYLGGQNWIFSNLQTMHDYLVEELLHYMGQEKTDKWAKQIQEDYEVKDLYKNNLGCV